MSASLHDFGFALRRLLRAPGYTATVIALLAFAIGANIILGSAVYAMRWKALPFADGDGLTVVQARLDKLGMTLPTSVYVLDRLEREAQGYTASGYDYQQSLREADATREWAVTPVRPSLFAMLGAAPALGRGIAADEVTPGRGDTLVLSHGTWQQRFNGDPAVLGRQVTLGDRAYTIVGVMPRDFAFPDRTTQAWSPFVFTDAAMASAREGNIGSANTIVRRDAGVTGAQVAEHVGALFANDPVLAGLTQGAGLTFLTTSLRAAWAGDRADSLLLLQGALLLVLVAVVTNVASLMFERLLGRQQEMGVRAAIGAGRGRLVFAAGAEALWLLVAGTAIGIALAPWGIRALAASGAIDADLPIVAGSLGDLAGVALVVAGLAGIAFAIIPLIAIYGAGAAQWLRPGVPSRNESRGVARTRRLLVVAQLAITTVLLSGAGLMTRSVANLLREDTGFDRRDTVVTGVRQRGERTAATPWRAAELDALVTSARGLPGVQSVALANMAPMARSESMSNYALPGDADDTSRTARSWEVAPDYFRTLGIALRQGREFTSADAGASPRPIIVDTLFARRHFGDRNAIGETVRIPAGGETMRDATVVGVADLVKNRSLDETPDKPSFYQPFAGDKAAFTLVLRTAGDPAPVVAPLRELVTSRLANADIAFAAPLATLARQTVRERETVLNLLAAFAGAAALVSAIGLYALMAVTVRRRAVEIGVRQALGADPRELGRWVLRQAARVALVGVAVGAVGSLGLARALGASLYGVEAYDPLTLGVVVVIVLAIALVATLAPARRAARMDPQACLRAQ